MIGMATFLMFGLLALPSDASSATVGETPPDGRVMWAYRDPVTGDFAEPPADEAAELRRQATPSTLRREPLRQLPVSAPAGGFRVRVGASFRTLLSARRTATGGLVAGCAPRRAGEPNVAEPIAGAERE